MHVTLRCAPFAGAALALLAPLAAAASGTPWTPSPAVAPGSPKPADELAPPSMVLVEGGKTWIGNTPDEVAELIQNGWPSMVVATQPQMDLRVADFYLMTTEVTNAQFAAFVSATGHRPPQHWGGEAINVARAEYLEYHGKLKYDAKQNGEVYDYEPFDPAAWWSENWEGKPWALPEGLDHHPVIFVDYSDAETYARWAGMRLPSEFEYERACRGDSKRTFPWGEEFERRKYMQSQENGVDKTTEVGSFPDGAVGGLYDLAGNVWEWTSSPFVALNKKYKPIDVQVGKRKSDTKRYMADWDANDRVVVGGCYKLDKRAAICTYRRRTERFQATDSLGFRCAATATPGVDMASTALAQDLPVANRPDNVTYDTSMALAADNWKREAVEGKVPGYAIIHAYEYILFFPVEKLPESNVAGLVKTAESEGPVHVGVLSSTVDLQAPALSAGTYFVAFRAKGKFKPEKIKDEDGETIETTDPLAGLEFDRTKEQYVFYDGSGTPVGTLAAAGMKFEKLAAPSASVQSYRPTASELEEDPTLAPYDTLRMDTIVPARSSSKAFRLELPVRVAPGALTDWRVR